MAIVQERKVQRVEVYPNIDIKPTIMVVYEHLFDDTEDADLPVSSIKTVYINAMTDEQIDENGDVIEPVATDISKHDPLVQTICNAVWAE